MYATHVCPYCEMAARLLEKKGIAYEKIYVDEYPDRRTEMIARAGRTSVPQIFVGDVHVGGYRELAKLEIDGQLDALLQSMAAAE